MSEAFSFSKQCCFCGFDNSEHSWGYAGERPCSVCFRGGNGEPDLPFMAYKGNLHEAPLSAIAHLFSPRLIRGREKPHD